MPNLNPSRNILQVNLGLARNDGAADNQPFHALAALYAALASFGYVVLTRAYRLADSATERTAVADLLLVHEGRPQTDAIAKAINAAAIELAQDCIAIKLDGAGALIGPNAAAWGEFNPQYWLAP